MTRQEAIDKARSQWGPKAGVFFAGGRCYVTPDDSWGSLAPIYSGVTWEDAFADADLKTTVDDKDELL